MILLIAGAGVGLVLAVIVVLMRTSAGKSPVPGAPAPRSPAPLHAGQEAADDVLAAHVRAHHDAYQRYDQTNEILGHVLERRKSVQTEPPKPAPEVTKTP